jgi:hypothetical protein
MMWIRCADYLGNIYPQSIHRVLTGCMDTYAKGLGLDNLLFLLAL